MFIFILSLPPDLCVMGKENLLWEPFILISSCEVELRTKLDLSEPKQLRFCLGKKQGSCHIHTLLVQWQDIWISDLFPVPSPCLQCEIWLPQCEIVCIPLENQGWLKQWRTILGVLLYLANQSLLGEHLDAVSVFKVYNFCIIKFL